MSDSDEKMPDIIKDIDRLPSDMETPNNRQINNLEGLEDKIGISNNQLDELNRIDRDEDSDVPQIMASAHPHDDASEPQENQSNPGEDQSEDQHMEQASMPGEDDSMPEENDVQEPYQEQYSDRMSDAPMRTATDMQSVTHIQNAGDDADSGDNTEDLDPRSEFEKCKEYNEELSGQINQYLGQLDQLRHQIQVLETEEFSFYSVKKKNESDPDPGAVKLEYQKAL